ncbi:MAG: methyltransferase domain-containing protein [Gallionella sp.]
MSHYWKSFFESYRILEVKSDADLRFQVGKSVGGKAISDAEFDALVQRIVDALDIKPHDHVLDLCCGNGVITRELANKCTAILGIDFSSPYIDNAKKYKAAPNINYVCDDVTNFSSVLRETNFNPTKVLMHGSLAYLTPTQLSQILRSLAADAPNAECFVVSAVPDAARRNLFHNTIKRKIEWLFFSVILGRDRGVGRWWSRQEVMEICKSHNFKASFDQTVSGHSYRMDIVITPLRNSQPGRKV